MEEKLRQKLRSLEIKARQLADNRLVGEWKSNVLGQGLEFRDLRDYVPGDDIRRLDWKATARTGKPQLRQFQEERQQTIHLGLDLSASMDFGDKLQYSRELLTLIGWTAVLQKDRFALTGFTDKIEFSRSPSRGEAQLWSSLQDIFSHETQSKKTGFKSLWRHFFQILNHKSTVIVISDFYGDPDLPSLKALAQRHDLWIIHITDPREFAQGGLVNLMDSETGEKKWVDTSQKKENHRMGFMSEEERIRFSLEIRRGGGWYAHFPVTRDPFSGLMEFLKTRERLLHV